MQNLYREERRAARERGKILHIWRGRNGFLVERSGKWQDGRCDGQRNEWRKRKQKEKKKRIKEREEERKENTKEEEEERKELTKTCQ